MGLFRALASFSGKHLAAIVDGVILRVKDKYTFTLKVVDGGFKLQIDDRQPETTERMFCEVNE